MINLFFLAEDINADSLLSLCSMKSITVLELDGLFSFCSSTFNSYVSLDFCLEKNASIFLIFFAFQLFVVVSPTMGHFSW